MGGQKRVSMEPVRTGDNITTAIYDSEHRGTHTHAVVIAGMIDQLVYNILNQGQLATMMALVPANGKPGQAR